MFDHILGSKVIAIMRNINTSQLVIKIKGSLDGGIELDTVPDDESDRVLFPGSELLFLQLLIMML